MVDFQTRSYTGEYHRISGSTFKRLINESPGQYRFKHAGVSAEHCQFELIEHTQWPKLMVFNINGKKIPIPLQVDTRSASNKVYLVCSYCTKQRQHLYATKSTYACRQCLKLHYACQSERPQERLMRRIRKLRKELWGYDWPDVNNMFQQVAYWPKPKYMRWTTFEKRRQQIIKLESAYWPMLISKVDYL